MHIELTATLSFHLSQNPQQFPNPFPLSRTTSEWEITTEDLAHLVLEEARQYREEEGTFDLCLLLMEEEEEEEVVS